MRGPRSSSLVAAGSGRRRCGLLLLLSRLLLLSCLRSLGRLLLGRSVADVAPLCGRGAGGSRHLPSLWLGLGRLRRS